MSDWKGELRELVTDLNDAKRKGEIWTYEQIMGRIVRVIYSNEPACELGTPGFGIHGAHTKPLHVSLHPELGECPGSPEKVSVEDEITRRMKAGGTREAAVRSIHDDLDVGTLGLTSDFRLERP